MARLVNETVKNLYDNKSILDLIYSKSKQSLCGLRCPHIAPKNQRILWIPMSQNHFAEIDYE
jgi:hypothetical protein